MSPRSKNILGLVALLVLALALTVYLRLPGPSDRDQILAQLETARAAAQASNVSGIMKVVSADYHGGSALDGNVDQLHFFLTRVFGRGGGPVTVTLEPPSVQVQGDTAVTVGQVAVHSRGDGTEYAHSITLHWKREDGTHWLVFPAKVWRVVGSEFQAPGGGDDSGGLP